MRKFDLKKFTPVFRELSFRELIEVAARPEFRKYFNSADIHEMIELMQSFGTFIEVISKVEVCRDPDDNLLLAMANDGKVEYLVTGDDDLLTLEKFNQTRILTIKDFLREI